MINIINVGIVGLNHIGLLRLMDCNQVDFIEAIAATDKSNMF